MSLVDEAIRQVDTALVWLEAPQERRRYNWHREEDAVLKQHWSRMAGPELAERVTEVLRRVTGDSQAERSVDGCNNRAYELGLKVYRGEPDELSLTVAAQVSDVPYYIITQAVEDGHLLATRKGKQVYVTGLNWALWFVAYRERVEAQGELLNALEGTDLVTKQEAMRLTRLQETHLTRYLQTGVVEAYLVPGIRTGRPGEWVVSRESAEALVRARTEGRLRALLDSCPKYVALRNRLTADIRDLRRAGRLERRDTLTEPGSLYHEGCFTVKQVASHVGLSAQVVYEAIVRGEIQAESVVTGGRARYAIRPEEAARYAEWVKEMPDTAARRDTFYLRQIKAAGLVTVRELARRWGIREEAARLRLKRLDVPGRKWGRYRVFEPGVIELVEDQERSDGMNMVMDVAVRPSPPLSPGPRGRGGKKKAEMEAAYQAALSLVAKIDEDLTRGIRHYRTTAGELLTTLDEVVRAILRNDLLLDEQQA